MHMLASKTEDKTIQQFISLVAKGIDCWIDAGKLIAENIDADPDFPDKLVAAVPGLSLETVFRFDRIGRGQLFPPTLLTDCPGMRRLRRLPIDTQRRFCEQPVSLLVQSTGDSLNVDVRNLSLHQARQVFDSDGVRSLAAQRSWLEEQSSREQMRKKGRLRDKYSIHGNRVQFHRDANLSLSELRRVLSELEQCVSARTA